MRSPYLHRETLRWNDADLQGVVNNAVYLTLFEQARLGYFGELGAMRGAAFPFLLGSTEVRFVRPARPGMTVDVEARVVRLGGASFDMTYRVEHAGATLAEGRATLVWIDAELRSTPIPDAVRRAVAALEGIAPGPGGRT